MGPNNAPFVYYTNNSVNGGKRVLLIMDSYFTDLSSNVGEGGVAPLLAENVPELIAIWYAYDVEQINALMDVFEPYVVIMKRVLL